MNEFDESTPGETKQEKSEKSRDFIKDLLQVYIINPTRTPARAKAILEWLVQNPNVIPYQYLYHISRLNPSDTKICIALINPENMPHMISLIYETLISHQNWEEILKQPVLTKINPENK